MDLDRLRHCEKKYDLLWRPRVDELIHWTGLKVSEDFLQTTDDATLDKLFASAETRLSDQNREYRKDRWRRYKEAFDWQINGFREWWREKTYPKENYEGRPSLSFKEMNAKHLKTAREYIRDYEVSTGFLPHKFTDKVPSAIKQRVIENYKLFDEVHNDTREMTLTKEGSEQ